MDIIDYGYSIKVLKIVTLTDRNLDSIPLVRQNAFHSSVVRSFQTRNCKESRRVSGFHLCIRILGTLHSTVADHSR